MSNLKLHFNFVLSVLIIDISSFPGLIYLTSYEVKFHTELPSGQSTLWRSQQTFPSDITNVAGAFPQLAWYAGPDDSGGSSSLSHTDSLLLILEIALFSSL